ncbi:MAG: serine hydrolase [Bacteroidetes bacterium]|nr:serine hydrolase [Bacteroidota bacterium]
MIQHFLLLLAAFALACPSVCAQDDPAEAILNVLAERPHDVSLVVYSLDDPEGGLYHNADVKRPLASTIKILVLAEYARRVEESELDPEELVPLDSVEAYFFHGTDGGAHAAAVTASRDAGRLENDKLTLSEIAEAMIRFSDNAAADYLIVRFGREAMDALPERLGLRYADGPVPISGVFLNWDQPHIEGENPSIYPDQPDDRAWMFAHGLRASENFSDDMGEWMEGMTARMSYDAQSAAALSFPAGSAREYAGLMAKAYQGELISEQVSATMLTFLDWPMDNPGVPQGFDQLATQSGSLAGILTSTYVVDARTQNATGRDPSAAVLALFTEGLPGRRVRFVVEHSGASAV